MQKEGPIGIWSQIEQVNKSTNSLKRPSLQYRSLESGTSWRIHLLFPVLVNFWYNFNPFTSNFSTFLKSIFGQIVRHFGKVSFLQDWAQYFFLWGWQNFFSFLSLLVSLGFLGICRKQFIPLTDCWVCTKNESKRTLNGFGFVKKWKTEIRARELLEFRKCIWKKAKLRNCLICFCN